LECGIKRELEGGIKEKSECGNENEKAGNRNEFIDMLKSGKFFDEG